jgi:hypothetical protein
MTNSQINEEYSKLYFEIFENMLKTNKPYSSGIVKRRKLLLYAQLHLAEVSWAKKCKDLASERLHTEAYNCVMSEYYG